MNAPQKLVPWIPHELRRLLDQISTARMARTLNQLCSEEFHGRSSASGNTAVAKWIAAEFAASGLAPVFQRFDIQEPVFRLIALPELSVVDEDGGVVQSFRHPESTSPSITGLQPWLAVSKARLSPGRTVSPTLESG